MSVSRFRRSIGLAVVITAIWVHGSAVGAGEPNAAAEQLETAPDGWEEVPPAEVVGVFQMLAARTQGNYERIQTWEATYAYRVRRTVSHREAAGLRPDLAPQPLQQEINYQLEVCIDSAAGAISRGTTRTALAWMNADTQEPVDLPNATVPDKRVIVTNEHCLHINPDHVYGSFLAVPDHPAAKNKRAAFRDSLKSAKASGCLSMPDPRQCFGRSDRRRLWEELELDIAALQGKQGEEKAARLRSRLHLCRADGKGGTWYREDLLMDSPGGEVNLARTLWSPDAGYHPVSFTLWQDESQTRPLVTREWSFKQVDGIYVPESMTETYYTDERAHRLCEFQLGECKLNRPIDPSRFSHAGLGLREGELIMDRIEGVCYIIRDGKPEKLAPFDAK